MIPNIKNIELRLNTSIRKSLICDIYGHLERGVKNLKVARGEYLDKDTEGMIIKKYCAQRDLLYDNIPFSQYIDEGAEQKVFYNEDDIFVTKLNDAIFYVNWSQYLESLLVHNVLFPETAYELVGFVTINNVLLAVVKQPYIKPTALTILDNVRKAMLSRGFVIKRRNDYIHEEMGLIIEDLHEENVLVREGVLFYIDTVIYLR